MKRTTTRLLIAAAAGAALGAAAPGPASADAFPTKPVKIIVGFRAGGGTDTLATVLAAEMEKRLGQPVVKESRAGAGGGKAAAAAKNARPDGYTLVMAVTATFAFNPVFLPERTPYTLDDFDYLDAVAAAQEAIYTRSDAPFKTWREMIDYAKAGHELTYAAVTPFDNLLVKYVNRRDGTDIRVIKTKGGSGALKNILGGHTQLGFSGGTHVKVLPTGDIRVLASLRPERLVASPEVPTLMELGYPLTFANHFMLAAPKGLPPAVKAKLVEAIDAAQRSAPVREAMAKLDFKPETFGPEGMAARVREDAKRYRELIEALR